MIKTVVVFAALLCIVGCGTEDDATIVQASHKVEQAECLQVITYAARTEGGKCKAYASPCDVPEGYVSCTPTGPSR